MIALSTEAPPPGSVRMGRASVALPSVPAGLENVILDEISTALGPLLWRSVRSVRFWGETAPAERHELFPAGAYERRLADLLEIQPPSVLVEPCERLAQLLCQPGTAQADHLAGSCVSVAAWARSEHKAGTALAFLDAAARCCPFNPVLALMVGREARDQAQYGMAERWLDVAVTVSRSGGSWETYVRSHLSYATMMLARGAVPAARRHALRARRRAERQRLGEVLAMAHHDLFVIAAECGDFAEAHRSARDALNAYGPGHARLVNLAFDLATLWMRQGYFEVVLPVYRTLLPRVEERFLPHIHGALARASGACGLASEHRQAVRALVALAVGPGSAEAWLDAGHGAISLSAWSEAEDYLERSLAISRQRQERKIEFLTEGLLPMVQSRNADRPLAVQDASGTGVDELAVELLGSLSRVTAGSVA